MPNIAILNTTKDYITVRIPRVLMERVVGTQDRLTEAGAFKILQAGMKEYREGRTNPLTSLRSLRSNGHRV
mgnify:CR=1 FL=1